MGVCGFPRTRLESIGGKCRGYRLRTIRQLLKRGARETQQQFDFLEEHPIIRPLSDYSLESLHQFRKERNYDERHAF